MNGIFSQSECLIICQLLSGEMIAYILNQVQSSVNRVLGQFLLHMWRINLIKYISDHTLIWMASCSYYFEDWLLALILLIASNLLHALNLL